MGNIFYKESLILLANTEIYATIIIHKYDTAIIYDNPKAQ